MGAFSRAARQQGWSKAEIDAVMTECRSGDYNHLLATLMDNTTSPSDDEDSENEFEFEGERVVSEVTPADEGFRAARVDAIVAKIKLPPTLKYDGMYDVDLVQFTELDRFSPSYGASFYVEVYQITRQAIMLRRAEVRGKFHAAQPHAGGAQ
jgi:hypothetical protein